MAEMTSQSENALVVSLVQALLGAISGNVRAIGLVASNAGVTLRYLLADDRDEDREEIEDVAFEFESLQPRGIEIQTEVLVDARWIRSRRWGA